MGSKAPVRWLPVESHLGCILGKDGRGGVSAVAAQPGAFPDNWNLSGNCGVEAFIVLVLLAGTFYLFCMVELGHKMLKNVLKPAVPENLLVQSVYLLFPV